MPARKGRFAAVGFSLALVSTAIVATIAFVAIAGNARASSAERQPIDVPALFVAQDFHNRITVFDAVGKELRVVDNPAGLLATDPQGNLYVANYHDQPYFKIFAPPYTKKPTIISFYNVGYLAGVAVDQKTGVFAVIVTPNEAGGNPSSVSFFRNGQTTPCATVVAPQGMGTFGGATNFDASGTLYFDYVYSPEADAVASIAGECNPGPIIDYTPAIHYIGYLQFNARNQLVIQQSIGFAGGPILTYSHPSNGSLGTLLGTTTLPNMDGEAPLMLALSSDGTGIWAAPPFRSGFALYKYPQGGAPIRVVRGFRDSSTGAVFPQLVP